MWGLVGVTAFSFTVIFTRIAVQELDPLFIGSSRAVIAGVVAGAALTLTRQRLPSARQWVRLSAVAAGVVVGFPMLTSYALGATTSPSAATHGAVVIGLLPAATAAMAVIRGTERPPWPFWVMVALGVVTTVVFAMLHGDGLGHVSFSDMLFFGAVAAAAVGYAEGGLLARELGAWQTVSWALVLSLPLMLALAVSAADQHPPSGSLRTWAALTYLSLVSMFLGFLAWYRGLAIGPMAQVSQVQLVQTVLTMVWAALFLGERITWTAVFGGLAVIACAGAAVRFGQARRPD